jgi:hypothetical protein
MEKSPKKSKQEKEHEREQERLLSILPMRKHFLKDYFNYLDKHIEDERKPSLRLTETFSRENGLEFQKIVQWAAEFEAFTDQEILWNIEELYEEVMKSDKKS